MVWNIGAIENTMVRESFIEEITFKTDTWKWWWIEPLTFGEEEQTGPREQQMQHRQIPTARSSGDFINDYSGKTKPY